MPPAITDALRKNDNVTGAKESAVLQAQRQLLKATRRALKAIYADVRDGLLETVGIQSALVEAERCSIIITLPPTSDHEQIARAIDMENVEAWCGEGGHVHVAIGPWYSTKDVDQVVLSVTKVVHVLLGLHASDLQEQTEPKGFIQRLLASAAEILLLQKRITQKKD